MEANSSSIIRSDFPQSYHWPDMVVENETWTYFSCTETKMVNCPRLVIRLDGISASNEHLSESWCTWAMAIDFAANVQRIANITRPAGASNIPSDWRLVLIPSLS